MYAGNVPPFKSTDFITQQTPPRLRGCFFIRGGINAYPAIANDYGLTKVPTTVFYTEGVKLRSIEGAYTAESLGRYLHALLTQEETAEEP